MDDVTVLTDSRSQRVDLRADVWSDPVVVAPVVLDPAVRLLEFPHALLSAAAAFY